MDNKELSLGLFKTLLKNYKGAIAIWMAIASITGYTTYRDYPVESPEIVDQITEVSREEPTNFTRDLDKHVKDLH